MRPVEVGDQLTPLARSMLAASSSAWATAAEPA
jgi:hypothetical protein